MNNKVFTNFCIKFSLYVILVAALASYPLYAFADAVLIRASIFNAILFYLLTIVAFFLIVRSAKKNPKGVLNSFLGSMGIKMMVSLAYLLLLMKNFQGRELDFAISFFAVYLICTSFEIYYLLHNLRQI